MYFKSFSLLFIFLFSLMSFAASTQQQLDALNTEYHSVKSAYLALLKSSKAPKDMSQDVLYFGFDEDNRLGIKQIVAQLNGRTISNQVVNAQSNSSLFKGGVTRLWSGYLPPDKSSLSIKLVLDNGLTQSFERKWKKKQGQQTIALLTLKHDKKTRFYLDIMHSPSTSQRSYLVKEALYDLNTKGLASVLLDFVPDNRFQMQWKGQRQSLAYLYTQAALDFGVPEYALSMRFDNSVDDAKTKLAHAEYLILSGDVRTASRVIDDISRYRTSAESNQSEYLKGLILLKENRLADAKKQIEKWSGKSSQKLMTALNVSAALSESGDMSSAIDVLLSVSAEGDALSTVLNDKRNLYLGTFYNWQGDAKSSKTFLSKVNLNSVSAYRALLTLGWSDVGMNDVSHAFAPWNVLAQKAQTDDRAVQESLLLVPYALTKMKRYEQAANAYTKAIDVFNGEINKLEQLLKQSTGAYWSNALTAGLNNVNAKTLAVKQVVEGKGKQAYLGELLMKSSVEETLDKLVKLKQLQITLSQVDAATQRTQAFYELNKKTKRLIQQYELWFNQRAVSLFNSHKSRLKKQLTQAEFLIAESYQRMAAGVE